MQGVFAVAACASVLAVALICIFLFANGIPAMSKIGFGEFLTGELWKPKNDIYGIFPMIIGSLYVTAGAIIIGVPIGILTAVFMAFYCPKGIYKPLKMATELLAGIPSVVYGFFGLVVLVPWVREIGRTLHQGGNGSSMITASILLGMMILPTIIGLTESALRAVPTQYYEGAVALGGTHERAIFTVVLPAAKSGVVAAIVLGIGRAIGETAALIYTAGTVAKVPKNVLSSGRTLAVHMYNLSSEGLYMNQAYATAVVLLVLVVVINTLSGMIAKRITKA